MADREFVETVQKRGAAIIAARGKSSAASAAQAALDAMKFINDPSVTSWYSSALLSDGNSYGVEPGLIFGFPCVTKSKGVEIVGHLEWDYFIREKMAVTQKELIEERSCIEHLLGGR